MDNLEKKDFFAALPKELIIKIMQKCSQNDTLYFSLTCKRIRSIYKTRKDKGFLFHLQGNRDKLFSAGLKFLLNTKFDNFDELKISNFKLQESLDKNFTDTENIFDKPYQHYLDNSCAINNVVTIVLNGCVVTDYSLVFLRKLFPKLVNLSIIRSYVTYSGKEFISFPKDQFSPIRKLTLTYPFLGDFFGYGLRPSSSFGWLLDSFMYKESLLKYEKSYVSKKRPVWRRSSRYKKTRITNNPAAHELDPTVMAEELRLRGIGTEGLVKVAEKEDITIQGFLNAFNIDIQPEQLQPIFDHLEVEFENILAEEHLD